MVYLVLTKYKITNNPKPKQKQPNSSSSYISFFFVFFFSESGVRVPSILIIDNRINININTSKPAQKKMENFVYIKGKGFEWGISY
jgi:hypothetical protein